MQLCKFPKKQNILKKLSSLMVFITLDNISHIHSSAGAGRDSYEIIIFLFILKLL